MCSSSTPFSTDVHLRKICKSTLFNSNEARTWYEDWMKVTLDCIYDIHEIQIIEKGPWELNTPGWLDVWCMWITVFAQENSDIKSALLQNCLSLSRHRNNQAVWVRDPKAISFCQSEIFVHRPCHINAYKSLFFIQMSMFDKSFRVNAYSSNKHSTYKYSYSDTEKPNGFEHTYMPEGWRRPGCWRNTDATLRLLPVDIIRIRGGLEAWSALAHNASSPHYMLTRSDRSQILSFTFFF